MAQFQITIRLTTEQDFWIEAANEDEASAKFDEEMDHYALTDDEVVNEARTFQQIEPGDFFYQPAGDEAPPEGNP